jgi:glucose/arabinose dehydrogenase
VTNLASFQTTLADPNQADPASETTILEVVQPTDIHNGAGMTFGPDGYLYFGLGDGGYYNDPSDNGQNGNTLLGALLRLDVDGQLPYGIPPDNPFVGNPDVLDEIWAVGLRNPWRFTFDSLTGDFYVTDVGETLWEELNLEPAGSPGGNNYGWRCYQGNMPFILEGCGPAENYTFPVYVRSHAVMCAIIGGYVYRGSQYPMIEGHYLIADLCTGRVSGLVQEPDNSWTIASAGRTPNGGITTFAQGPDGELYIVSYGTVYRIRAEIITLTPQIFMPIVHN